MTERSYEIMRPSISADLRRAVEVESGHCCAIKGCNEHTYLEVHHIDQNRENNKISNLILLCDKHHKMAHANVIDRKALREYKKLLSESHVALIHERFDQLEKLINDNNQVQPVPTLTKKQPADDNTKKLAAERHDILFFVLTQVAICHYEEIHKLYFEHQVVFIRGNDNLLLDALRQDDDLESDIIIDVHYFRKSYMDAPVYGSWLEKKIELYGLLTGRKERGILLAIVSNERMKGESSLPLTEQGVNSCSRDIVLEVYSCEDIGFHPGAVSTAALASNLK